MKRPLVRAVCPDDGFPVGGHADSYLITVSDRTLWLVFWCPTCIRSRRPRLARLPLLLPSDWEPYVEDGVMATPDAAHLIFEKVHGSGLLGAPPARPAATPREWRSLWERLRSLRDQYRSLA